MTPLSADCCECRAPIDEVRAMNPLVMNCSDCADAWKVKQQRAAGRGGMPKNGPRRGRAQPGGSGHA